VTEAGAEVNVPIRVAPDVLATFGEPAVRDVIQHLVSLFKKDYEGLFPVDVDIGSFLFLRHLSAALRDLSACNGFAEHVAEYRNDVDSTYLVTVIAHHVQRQVAALELEPPIPTSGKRGDIRLTAASGEVMFVECKSPKKEILSALEAEHEEMYAGLRDAVVRPCDVFVSYEETLSAEKLGRLAAFLKDCLPAVTSDGTILDVPEVKVEVTNVRDSLVDIGDVRVQMLLDNHQSASRDPVTLINRDGVAIGFAKRNVSLVPSVERQFRSARKQVPDGVPLVLVVQAGFLTGARAANVSAIAGLFQPTKNTRVNAVVVADWTYTPESLIEPTFTTVMNPYAKNPAGDLSQMFLPRA
jgi:hypothetical protein